MYKRTTVSSHTQRGCRIISMRNFFGINVWSGCHVILGFKLMRWLAVHQELANCRNPLYERLLSLPGKTKTRITDRKHSGNWEPNQGGGSIRKVRNGTR